MIQLTSGMSAIVTMAQVLLMFAMGLTLTIPDFTRIVRQPLAFAVGLSGQIILLPVVAFLIAYLLDLPAIVAIGLMIIAACPGGTTSNAFSFLAKGDVALSISLTAISGVLAFITTPVIIGVGLAFFADQSAQLSLPFLRTSMNVILITALPIIVGMICLNKIDWPWQRIQKWLFGLALTAILVPSVSLVANNLDTMRDALGTAALSAVILNISMLLAGWSFAMLCRLPQKQRITIGLEVGLQNLGLAIVIIVSFLKDINLLLPGLFYVPSMLMTGALVIFYSKWRRAE